MRYLFAAALVVGSLLPFSAAAKNWMDQNCTVTLSTGQSDPPFLLTENGGKKLACRVRSWPMDTDIASMSCEDGTSPNMALMPSGQVLFGIHHLYPEGRYCGEPPAEPADAAPAEPTRSTVLPPIAAPGLAGLTEICTTGKHADGSAVAVQERRAACDEAIAGMSRLMRSGYCPSADALTWVPCEMSSPASGAALSCNTYTSELWEPGLRTATLDERGGLVIVSHGERKEYPDSVTTTTREPYRVARARDGHEVRLRPYQGVLIVDMEVFVPYCGAEPIVTFDQDKKFETWAGASFVCLSGEQRGGAKVSEEEAEAACTKATAILAELKQAGYCRAASGTGWQRCY